MLLNGVVHPIIFDVGANKGDITRLYRSRFPNSVIYAFEPFPPSYAQLVESTREDSSVFAQPVALGKETGTIVMQVNTSSATNSLLETEQVAEAYWGHGQVQTISRVEVEVTTLDDFCKKHTVEHIDILKLDTQGTEIQTTENNQKGPGLEGLKERGGKAQQVTARRRRQGFQAVCSCTEP